VRAPARDRANGTAAAIDTASDQIVAPSIRYATGEDVVEVRLIEADQRDGAVALLEDKRLVGHRRSFGTRENARMVCCTV